MSAGMRSTVALLLTGCIGSVSDPGLAARNPGVDPRVPTVPDLPTCRPELDGPVVQPLERLSRRELDQTLRDLLGETLHSQVSIELGAVPEDAQWAAEGLAPLSEAHVEGMVAVANDVADRMTLMPGHWDALGHGCMATGGAECVTSFIADFGLRVFRRPLTIEEITDLETFYAAPGDHDEGARRLVMRMLLSPQLLFHLELEGELTGDALALDDYVVASRISYAVLGTMPTDELLAQAAAGELSTQAQVEATVRALLDEPRARTRIAEFFDDWLRLDGTPVVPAYLADELGLAPAELRDAMLDETRTFLSQALWNEAWSYRELLTSQNAYPTSDAVASIYGVPVWSEGSAAPTTGPERQGLLLRAALLTHKGTRVAPIHRGVVVRRRILCDQLPSPDSEIIASRLMETEAVDPASESSREQITRITSPAGCQTCHRMINGVAFALEEYDALGRYRTEEEVHDASGTVIATHPIDPNGVIVMDAGREVEVGSAAELVSLLAESDRVSACLARTVYEYTRQRPSAEGDQCALTRLTETVVAGDPLTELFVRNVADTSTLTRRLVTE
jgi:hypothetical protein